MKLFYREFGTGQPLIILHGLFGQSDNWNSLAKQFADKGFRTISVDLRNHGLSPQSNEWNYSVMSDDILELINDKQLTNPIIIGHSMGGKVAMKFAMEHTNILDKLVVVDISPKYYPIHHQLVLDALSAVDFAVVKNRKEVEDILSSFITDNGTKQFLLKNIYWKENGELDWRFNFKVIAKNIENVGELTPSTSFCETATLFIRGEKSNYILDEDLNQIQELFPRSMLKTIAGAGHWVHAEKPKEFFECVIDFIV